MQGSKRASCIRREVVQVLAQVLTTVIGILGLRGMEGHVASIVNVLASLKGGDGLHGRRSLQSVYYTMRYAMQ